MDIKLMQQPPNSPDLNALDLGYFRSLESLSQERLGFGLSSRKLQLKEGVKIENEES